MNWNGRYTRPVHKNVLSCWGVRQRQEASLAVGQTGRGAEKRLPAIGCRHRREVVKRAKHRAGRVFTREWLNNDSRRVGGMFTVGQRVTVPARATTVAMALVLSFGNATVAMALVPSFGNAGSG